jgi:hypothetical protein
MVSKGRHVSDGGDEFSFKGTQIAVVNDLVLDELNRTLKFRAAGYSGNIGDVVIMGVQSGKSVTVGEISGTGPDETLVVNEPQDVVWVDKIVADLTKPGQKLIVVFAAPAPHVHVQRLSIGLYLGLSGDDLAKPRPVVVDSNLNLDWNGDGTITDAEAEAFVEQAKALIKRPERLPLGELALGIPSELMVTGVGLSGLTPAEEEKTMFNEFAAQVKVVDGKQFVYVEWADQATHGVGVNRFGDVDRARFDDFIKDIYEINAGPPPYDPRVDEQQQPWELSRIYIKLVDKERETVVVEDELIKSIKRVKKCGKRYYKLELADIGLVPNIQAGKYEDCLAVFSCYSPIGVNPGNWIGVDPDA